MLPRSPPLSALWLWSGLLIWRLVLERVCVLVVIVCTVEVAVVVIACSCGDG